MCSGLNLLAVFEQMRCTYLRLFRRMKPRGSYPLHYVQYFHQQFCYLATHREKRSTKLPDNMLLGHQLLLMLIVLASTQPVPENKRMQCSALANELSATNTPDAAFSLCLSARLNALEAHGMLKRDSRLPN